MSGIYVTADPRLQEKGRLWRVKGPDNKENFILGTIHVDSKVIHDATPEFNQIFTSSKAILFEYPDLETVASEALLTLDYVLSNEIDNNLLSRLQPIIDKVLKENPSCLDIFYKFISDYYKSVHKIDSNYLEPLKTLDLVSLFHLYERVKLFVGTKIEPFDNKLFQDAKKLKELEHVNTVANIEPFRQILQSDYNLIPKLDDAELEIVLSVYALASTINTMTFDSEIVVPLYLSGFFEKAIKLTPKTLRKSQVERNLLMFNDIKKYFARGDALLCVGIAHCLGNQGILQLLQQNNYTIERVLETPNLVYFGKQIHKELFAIFYRLELVAMALSLLNNENYNKYNYTAIIAVGILYILEQLEKNTTLSKQLSQLPLLYILGSVLLNPGWIRFGTLASLVPLSRLVFNRYSEFTDVIDNSGPAPLHKEFMKRSKLLYKDEAPVNSRSMLTSYNASRNANTVDMPHDKPKRQTLRFISA